MSRRRVVCCARSRPLCQRAACVLLTRVLPSRLRARARAPSRRSSFSAPSGAPLAAAALPTPEEVRGWSKKDVASWASKLGLDDDDVAKLVDQKIDGKRLLDEKVVARADLERWGMSGGAAGDVMNAVAAIKEAGGMAPTDGGAGGGGAGGAGAGACG